MSAPVASRSGVAPAPRAGAERRPSPVTHRPEADQPTPPSDSARGRFIVGFAIIAVFFGGFGAWAVTAPLNGAVVSNAVVKVEGNRKSVQHLDGGIVRELLVQEGQHVREGEVLIVLDQSQARAEYEVLSQQYIVLRASEVRLLTELAHGSALAMPPELAERSNDAYVQGNLFRKDATQAQKAILDRPGAPEAILQMMVISQKLLDQLDSEAKDCEQRHVRARQDAGRDQMKLSQADIDAAQCMCSVLRDIRRYNKGMLPAGDFQNWWESYSCQ